MNEQKLREFVNEWCPSIHHNYIHMRNVETFGELLSREINGVDNDIVHWFAYLHDIKKEYDDDSNHGEKAAEFVELIRNRYLSDLTNNQIDKLKIACALHTTTHKTGYPTIDVCFDADRLDFPRCGIAGNPDKMATNLGKQLVKSCSYSELCRYAFPFFRDKLELRDDYLITTPYIGRLALRFNLCIQGKSISPLIPGYYEWNCNAKSIIAHNWFEFSGIYAIPAEKYNRDCFYETLIRMGGNDVLLSLIEYDDSDIILEKDQCKTDKMAKYVDVPEELSKLFTLHEVILKKCNIVYSASANDFFNNWKDKLMQFSELKYEIYTNEHMKGSGNIFINLCKAASKNVIRP